MIEADLTFNRIEIPLEQGEQFGQPAFAWLRISESAAVPPLAELPFLDNLVENCLKPFGRMIFTMPLGYNPSLDRQIFNGDLCFDRQFFLKRISKNEWFQVDQEELEDYGYGSIYIEASVVVIAEYNAVKVRRPS